MEFFGASWDITKLSRGNLTSARSFAFIAGAVSASGLRRGRSVAMLRPSA